MCYLGVVRVCGVGFFVLGVLIVVGVWLVGFFEEWGGRGVVFLCYWCKVRIM